MQFRLTPLLEKLSFQKYCEDDKTNFDVRNTIRKEMIDQVKYKIAEKTSSKNTLTCTCSENKTSFNTNLDTNNCWLQL